MFSQTDLSLFQDIRLAGTNVQLGLTVLNLWDQDTVTRLDNTRMVASLPITLDQFFNTGFDYEGILAGDPSLVDPKFRQANQFQAPREVRLTLKFEF